MGYKYRKFTARQPNQEASGLMEPEVRKPRFKAALCDHPNVNCEEDSQLEQLTL